MIPAIRSEIRKLLTVRSTYAIIGFSLGVVALFAGFGDGYRGTVASLAKPNLLASESASAILFAGLILAFAGLLLMGHEYRFNTIMYSLTATNRRLKVLFAKVLVVTVFAIITSVLVSLFSPLCTIVGAHLHGHAIGPQIYPLPTILWHSIFSGWGYAMYALLLVTILRNQIGAIVTFLMVPLIGETILTGLLSGNDKYLPFRSVQAVSQTTTIAGGTSIMHDVTVVLVYVAGGLLVAAVLFTRRDAN